MSSSGTLSVNSLEVGHGSDREARRAWCSCRRSPSTACRRSRTSPSPHSPRGPMPDAGGEAGSARGWVNRQVLITRQVTTGTDAFRAGAGRVSIEPPLGLPMLGFVRRFEPASGYGLPLEVTALALERGGTKVILVGVDTALIAAPEVDRLRDRIADATGARPAGVLVNWNHTHNAPPGSRSVVINGGIAAIDEFDGPTIAYIDVLQEKILSAALLACERLEPARPVWGVGEPRRERQPPRGDERRQGHPRVDPGGLVDQQVTVLQARRPDESAICTVVGYGCPASPSDPTRCSTPPTTRARCERRSGAGPAARPSSSKARGATCCRGSRSGRPRRRPFGLDAHSPSKPCTRSPAGRHGRAGSSVDETRRRWHIRSIGSSRRMPSRRSCQLSRNAAPSPCSRFRPPRRSPRSVAISKRGSRLRGPPVRVRASSTGFAFT